MPLNQAIPAQRECTDARCPVPNCTHARTQFLEPNFDPLSNAVPKYARFEVCSDRAFPVRLSFFEVLTHRVDKCSLQRCPGRRASSRDSFCQARKHRMLYSVAWCYVDNPLDACQAEDCVNLRQEQRNCCAERMSTTAWTVRKTHTNITPDQCKTAGCRAIAESEYPYCTSRRSILPHARPLSILRGNVQLVQISSAR
jgi:hypothetical protein